MVKIRLLICSAGPKFWRSSKVIRAISDQDFQRLELARSGQPGTSGVYTRKPSPLIHVVSDTDSEDGFRPLAHRKKQPAQDSQSDSDSYLSAFNVIQLAHQRSTKFLMKLKIQSHTIMTFLVTTSESATLFKMVSVPPGHSDFRLEFCSES